MADVALLQQQLEKEIREGVACALEKAGVLDDTRISQQVVGSLSTFSFEQFKAIIEGACRKDPELWQKICAWLPEESACQGWSPQANINRAHWLGLCALMPEMGS